MQPVPDPGHPSLRVARSNEIETLLASLTALRGVTAAALVDGDGFVTHIRRDFEINTDALGAAVQVALGAAHQAGRHVAHGPSELLLMENKEGISLVAPLTRGFVLAVIADRSALLGALRFEVKEAISALNQRL